MPSVRPAHRQSPRLAVVALAWLLAAPGLAQQDPAEPPAPVVVITAGTIHPVAGPDIRDGVILIRGERIAELGTRDQVAIPEGATRFDYPQGHVYPGLIDALTDAYTDGAQRADATLDAASQIADTLRVRGDREDRLAAAGITTAWIGSRATAVWRGQGSIVRPQIDDFVVWRDRGQGAVQMRMTAGLGNGHALQRQQMLDGLAAAFDGLDAYQKAFDDHKKALDKYKQDYEAYLSFYRKKQEGVEKKDAPPAQPAAPANPAEGQPRGTGGTGERPRGGRREGGGRGNQGTGGGGAEAPSEAGQDPQKQEPAKAEAPKQDPAAPKPEEKKEDKAPQKPAWPKAPARDPARDALQRVLDGGLALRVEALRPDEIRAALALGRARKVPILILEQAYGAESLAGDLAGAGIACVLTDVLPASLPRDYGELEPARLPAILQQHGVAFAIATGSARRADCLTLMAATAIGRGLAPDAALRAITLTPAELLGIAKDTGSLQVGKLGDVLVADRPLFLSDSRVVHVLSAGKTILETK